MDDDAHAQLALTGELLSWIERQTDRMLASAAGLGEHQVRAPVVPSGWSILGLLGHVADSTDFWLGHVVLGVPVVMSEVDAWPEDPDGPADQVVAEAGARMRAACASVRAVPADQPPGWWPEGAFGGYRQESVRGVLLHLLADNTAHAGHLDIARELSDGGVWDFALDGVRVPPDGAVAGPVERPDGGR